jgi:hypothetical protein
MCLKRNFDKEPEQTFRNFETVEQKVMDLDPNVERSMLRMPSSGVWHRVYVVD